MSQEREELKGKLLSLWLEGLKNDGEPGLYPEMKSLSAGEIQELMSLARFVKATFYPSEASPTPIDDYAKKLAALVYAERVEHLQAAKTSAGKVSSFGTLVCSATISPTQADKRYRTGWATSINPSGIGVRRITAPQVARL